NWGPCGIIDDDFTVASTQPYRIDHTISGNLDLTGFTGVDPRASTIRTVQTDFTATGATGTLSLAAQAPSGPNVVICRGTLLATYTAAHPTIPLPTNVISRIVFQPNPQPLTPTTFFGMRTRIASRPVPASSPGFIAALAAGLLALGVGLIWR